MSPVDLGLSGKVVVLSGGSMGIGFACARAFAAEGAKVAMAARNQARLDQAAEAIRQATPGAEVLPISADMTRTEDVQRFISCAADRWGRIDVLLNVAGAAPGGLLEDLSDEAWWGGLNLKFLGYMRMLRAVLPIMVRQGGGRVVNIVGNDGGKPYSGEIVPGAANAADYNLTQALAEQYAKHNILINAINPGPVATERWDTLEKAMARDKGISQEQVHQATLRSLPLGRICTPQEVATLALFLASACNTYITGALIPIDGAQRKPLLDA
jgi:NAD(P)-dependent dehydrogenase (short-subunit alcohol dehydrogenase family)